LLKVLASAECELFFVVGADILPELPRWRDPEEIVRLARLVVVTRPGAPGPDLQEVERWLPGAGSRAAHVEIPGLAIASRELRERVRAGMPIHYLTPPAVERYILKRGLYRALPVAR
jgi:nicotinate-nucleotide adenylyltransferase